MKDAIVAESLGKTFMQNGLSIVAVRDLSLRVEAGELFGLFGHNGAGKSTLVRMLATLVRPSHGTARINGCDLVRDEQQVRAAIGLVASDERSFYGRLNAIDNLHFYAALQNMPRHAIAARVRIVLDLFGLSSLSARPVQAYSTGQKQRLNLARALLHDPPILFLDEPTKSMDVQTSDFVKDLVKRELVGRQGKTVFFISHELYEMENFCDRVAVIAHGELRALGTPNELMRQLPTQPRYHIEVEGHSADIVRALQQLACVAHVSILEQGDVSATLDVQLAPSANGAGEQPSGALAWQTALWQTINNQQGHIRAYRQSGGQSLRDVIRHFSGD
jgi:ABC-2 type transport system ATP-binding protein